VGVVELGPAATAHARSHRLSTLPFTTSIKEYVAILMYKGCFCPIKRVPRVCIVLEKKGHFRGKKDFLHRLAGLLPNWTWQHCIKEGCTLIKVDINVDGLLIYKNGEVEAWSILGRSPKILQVHYL